MRAQRSRVPRATPTAMPALAPGERGAGCGERVVVVELLVGFERSLVNDEEAAAAVEAPPAVVVAAAMEFEGVAAAEGPVLWTLVKMMG